MRPEIHPINVGALFDTGPWTARQRAVALMCGAAILFDGFQIVALGLAAPAIMRDWGLSEQQFTPIFALSLAGTALGSFVAGYFGDRFGRRSTLIVSVGILGVMSTSIVFVNSLTALAILRIAACLGLGGCLPTAAALVAEYTPARHRSSVVTLAAGCMPLGSLVAGLLAALILQPFGWRAFLIFGGLCPLIVLVVLVFFLPESARMLAHKPARRRELIGLLRRFGFTLGDDAVFEAQTKSKSTSVRVLFAAPLRADTARLAGAFLFSLIGAYTLANWLPLVLAGIGLTPERVGVAYSAAGLGGLIGSLVGAGLVGKFGSRWPMTVFGVATVAFAIVLRYVAYLASDGQFLLCAVLFSFFFCSSMIQTSLFAVGVNCFPTPVRNAGMGLVNGIGRMGSVLGAYVGGYALHDGGPQRFFAAVAACYALSILCVVFTSRHTAPAIRTRSAL
ncbi:MAG: transporter [Gammaproteobacteria bacterium]|nr:transporter [Gammaproteobacteria bacterium]